MLTDYVNGFSENSVNFCNTNPSNSVLPLQSYTNEQPFASCSVLSSVPEPSSSWHSISGVTKLRVAGGENASQDSLKLTRISSTSRQTIEGNIQTGAPPPWLTGEGNQLEITLKAEQRKKAGKSSRLNPKRVGAAWAERRKLELELESRGEHVPNNFGSNWLPNFGGVWQSGTRKESRKEFQSEHKSSHTVDDQLEALLQLQPYISKRMRTDTSRADDLH